MRSFSKIKATLDCAINELFIKTN